MTAGILVASDGGSGREFRSEGFVEGDPICGSPYGPVAVEGGNRAQRASDLQRRIDLEVELIECMAGIAAEARYRKMAIDRCALDGGVEDVRCASALLDGWCMRGRERELASVLAMRRASAIVGSAEGAAAIKAMAWTLHANGTLDGAQVHGLYRIAYGGRACAYGAWRPTWPPTLQQLRVGAALTVLNRDDTGTNASSPIPPRRSGRTR